MTNNDGREPIKVPFSIQSWIQTLLLFSALVISALLLRSNLNRVFTPNKIPNFDVNKAVDIVDQYHINRITPEQYTRGILNGIASELGPYARCYTPEELNRHNELLDGAFVGVGVRLKQINGKLTVVYPIPNTASEKAGVKPGDVLHSADGISLMGLSLNDAAKYLRGPINSVVKLKVLRAGYEEPVEFTIVRSAVPTTSISYAQLLSDNETGFIRIEEFSRDTATDMKKAIAKLRNEGMKKLIVDLRHNGGGLFNVGVACADLFLSKGVIVISRSGPKDAPDETIYTASATGTLDPMPLAFLIDGQTASASEIFGAALKDHKKAIFVGSKSYGKGTVQTTFTEGLGGFGLKFTTGLFYSPNNTKIEGNGIQPDIKVPVDEEAYQYLMLKYDILETRLYLPDYEPDTTGLKYSYNEIMAMVDQAVEAAMEALNSWVEPKGTLSPAVEHPLDRPGLVQ